MAVYDDEKELAGSHDDLGVHPERREAEVDQLRKQYEAPSSPRELAQREGSQSHSNEGTGSGDETGEKSLNPEELASAENNSANGEDYNYHNEKGNVKGGAKKKKRKYLLLGGGLGGGLLALIFAGFLALLPLKLEHVVSNLESHFFSSSTNAVEKETNNMFKSYIQKYVGPALMKSCGSTIDKNCKVPVTGTNNPITKLYKTWSQAKFENKLADKYGIEFKYDAKKKIFYMKTPATKTEEAISHAGEDHIDTSLFEEADRGSVKQAIKDAVQNESRLTKVLFRFKVGRLLEEKYGIKRCILFCGIRDNITKAIKDKKEAAKIFLVNRVITPRNKVLGIALECLLSSTCNPSETEPSACTEGSGCGELNSEPENPETDTSARTTLEEYASKLGLSDAQDVEKLVQTYQDAEDKGISATILRAVLEKVGLGELTDKITTAGNILGWVNNAANYISDIKNAYTKIKKLAYITDAASAVSIYMTYRTYADEMKTGNVNSTEVGSFINSLGPGNQAPQGSKSSQVGGTASAESTPLYSYLMGGNTTGTSGTTASLLSSILPSKVYAAANPSSASTNSTYLCNNGKPPTGLVCPSEIVGLDTNNNTGIDGVLQYISNLFKNNPFLSIIGQLANLWTHSLLGKIASFISNLGSYIFSLVTKIPGISNIVHDFTSFLGNIFHPFIKFIESKLIPSPFGVNMSGGRTFDEIAAGADVAGNSYAHHGLGGERLTNQQVAAIQTAQIKAAKQQFDSQPVMARIFSTSSPYSLVSRIAMDIPFGSAGTVMESSFGSLLNNPVGKLFSGFGSIFSGHTVFAAATPQPDPFNVTQYGYPLNDPVFTTDPATYWTQNHCSNTGPTGPTALWNKAASDPSPNASLSDPQVDPNTGMPLNTTTDGCLLLMATVGSAGGYFSTSNLTPSDLADSSGSSVTPSSSQTTNNLNFQWPEGVVNNSKITITKCYSWNGTTGNTGITITGAKDTPVYAATSGIVSFAGKKTGYGYFIAINSDSGGYGTSYGNLFNILVKQGQHVSQGQMLGYQNTSSSNTQQSNLYFGVFPNTYTGKNSANVDPLYYIPIPSYVSNPNLCV